MNFWTPSSDDPVLKVSEVISENPDIPIETLDNQTDIFTKIWHQIENSLSPYQELLPTLTIACGILLVGVLVSFLVYFITFWLIRRLNIIQLIAKFTDGQTTIGKVPIDSMIAKSAGWFVFLISLRQSVKYVWFNDVEVFLSDLILYLPNLFIAILIAFFGLRFSDTIHDVVFHTIRFSDEKTGKVLANMARSIILFFTFMIVLNYIKIVDKFIINAVLVGFIAMVSLAWGLAFGLGGKEFAQEVINGFRQKSSKPPKKSEKNKEKAISKKN